MPEEPVFHLEGNAFIKSGKINVQTMSEIVGMNAFGPTVSQFLFQSAAGKFQPAAIEVSAEFFGAGHPNQDRRGIGHFAKTPLAFPEGHVGLAEQSIALLPLSTEDGDQKRGDANNEKEKLDMKDWVIGHRIAKKWSLVARRAIEQQKGQTR